MFLSLIMNQENVVQDQEETTVRTTKNEEENLQTCSDESCKSKGNKGIEVFFKYVFHKYHSHRDI